MSLHSYYTLNWKILSPSRILLIFSQKFFLSIFSHFHPLFNLIFAHISAQLLLSPFYVLARKFSSRFAAHARKWFFLLSQTNTTKIASFIFRGWESTEKAARRRQTRKYCLDVVEACETENAEKINKSIKKLLGELLSVLVVKLCAFPEIFVYVKRSFMLCAVWVIDIMMCFLYFGTWGAENRGKIIVGEWGSEGSFLFSAFCWKKNFMLSWWHCFEVW